MKGSLEFDENMIKRNGPLNIFSCNTYLVVTNPSEVLAHEDELIVKISGRDLKITDQAYTKILRKSNVKIVVEVTGDKVDYFPHPIIFYNSSRARLYTKVVVRERAKIIEAYILGRKGSMEEFVEGDILAITEVFYGDKLLIYDVFRGDGYYKSRNIMGKEALLTVYEVEDGEYKFNKIITDYQNIDKTWRDLTGIYF
ncbi:urease accessory protein UreD [Stygiolobus caldivivus]|uniref:Urease accessory protein UreH n=1 Tax=Stygiolobus caldivivus TaxID=2824673 RepID=A0A8D5UA23_9CREN|nr:urease accessory protein UreD [Stygiolobus caldivivus]BCU71618.1 hypothetical protein KN1_29150 [Stygiolobus caldivivus]